MVYYVWGTDLPLDIQREALERYRERYTGDHRPSWVDGPFVGSDRKNGPPDFEDDNAWLANVEFPIAGKGTKHLRLARNPSTIRTHYLPRPWMHSTAHEGVTAEQATKLALALAVGTGLAVWVQVDGVRVGDMSFHRPINGLPSMWRLATPKGDIY